MKEQNNDWLLKYIDAIPNFPKLGITFFSLSKILKSPKIFKQVISEFVNRYCDKDIQYIAALDARGFIFGSALAYALEIPLVLVRKADKLPGKTHHINYSLEYGINCLAVEYDAVPPGSKILIIDDVLATGGTARAAGALFSQIHANIFEHAFILEIVSLKGREWLSAPCFSIIKI